MFYKDMEVFTIYFLQELKRRDDIIQKQINIVENNLSHSIEGGLKVDSRNGRFYYSKQIYDTEKHQYVCKYIKRSEIEIAKQIALRDYCLHLKEVLLKEHKAIQTISEMDFDKGLNDCYTELDEGRKCLLNPLVNTAQSVIDMWNHEDYEQNKSHPENLIHLTDRGEYVRSKSEEVIANYLYSMKDLIDYKYERPFSVFVNGKQELIFPDFTILNLRTGRIHILEHVSRLDLENYHDKFVWKHGAYVENGLIQDGTVIYSFESATYPLNIKYIKKLVNDIIL